MMTIKSLIILSSLVVVKSSAIQSVDLPTNITYRCEAITNDPSIAKLTIDNISKYDLRIFNEDSIKQRKEATSIVLEHVPAGKSFLIDISMPSHQITVHANLFSLKCNIKKDPYEIVVAATEGQKQGSTVVPIPTKKAIYIVPSAEYVHFTMDFGKTGPYVIGDTLSLTIAVTGSVPHLKYRVLKCNATDSIVSSQQYQLSTSDGCPTSNAKTDGVFTGRWINTTGSTKTHPFVAFRFSGSKKVKLTCSVRVCTDLNEFSECEQATCTRKRRSTGDKKNGNKLIHKYVETEFKVYDTLQEVSGSNKNTPTKYSLLMVLWCSFWIISKLNI